MFTSIKTSSLPLRSGSVFALIACAAITASAGTVDLNTWSQAGPLGNGNWNVNGSGTVVTQTINGAPTLFIGPDDLFNDNIQGDIEVITTGDDDYIGFVFGYQSVNDFYLFDWKQGNQSGSLSGFTLAHVTGGVNSIPFGNHQTSSGGYQVLATNTFGNNGWLDNTKYTFTIGYNAGSIVASVEGGQFATPTNVLSYNGTFSTGRYGFYNYSQAQVQYSAFEDEAEDPVGAVPEPASLAVFGFGVLGLAAVRRRRRSAV